MTTFEKLTATIKSNRSQAADLRQQAATQMTTARQDLFQAITNVFGAPSEMNGKLQALGSTAQAKIGVAMATIEQARALDSAADLMEEAMKADGASIIPEGHDYALVTVNGDEFVDFKARFTGISNSGMFSFTLLTAEAGGNEDTSCEFDMLRSILDTLPSDGCFGLPEYDGRNTIAPNVHTVRLRADHAKELGLL